MKEAIEKHDMAAWKESFVGGTLVSVERCLKFPRVREGYCSATIQSLFGITRKWEIVGTLACVKLRKRRKDPCLEWWTSDVAVTLITETRGNEELIEGRKEVWYKIQVRRRSWSASGYSCVGWVPSEYGHLTPTYKDYVWNMQVWWIGNLAMWLQDTRLLHWIELRKWNYSECCWGDVSVKLERHLPKTVLNHLFPQFNFETTPKHSKMLWIHNIILALLKSFFDAFNSDYWTKWYHSLILHINERLHLALITFIQEWATWQGSCKNEMYGVTKWKYSAPC